MRYASMKVISDALIPFSSIPKQQINYQNIKMVLLKTLLIIYAKNDKKHSNKSVKLFYKIGILKNFAK